MPLLGFDGMGRGSVGGDGGIGRHGRMPGVDALGERRARYGSGGTGDVDVGVDGDGDGDGENDEMAEGSTMDMEED